MKKTNFRGEEGLHQPLWNGNSDGMGVKTKKPVYRYFLDYTMFNVIFRDILRLKRGLKMQMNPVPTNQISVLSVVIFRSKNIKQGNIFNLIYLYAWLIIQMRYHLQISKWNAKKNGLKSL